MGMLRRASAQRSLQLVALLVVFGFGLASGVAAQSTDDASPAVNVITTQTPATDEEVLAQETATAAATATQTPIPPPAVISTRPIEKNDLRFSLIAFGAALIAIVLLLIFMRWSFSKSLGALVGLARKGRAVAPERIVATMDESQPAFANRSAANAAALPASIKITGPLSLEVGKESKFTASSSNLNVPLPTLSWSKVETDQPDPVLAIIPNETGSEVTIKPLSAGSFKLKVVPTGADKGNWDEATADLIVQSDKAADSSSTKIPFFGQGYGTQILALFLMAVIAVLAMSQRISSDAAAGVIGATAGYIFGATVAAKRDDSNT